MIRRCEDPRWHNYPSYGGKGVQVCPEWHDFTVFEAWIEANLGPRPDGKKGGDYRPGNVRWADAKQQRANQQQGYTPHGEQATGAAQAKLTEVQVREMRERYAAGGISLQRLGAEYGGQLLDRAPDRAAEALEARGLSPPPASAPSMLPGGAFCSPRLRTPYERSCPQHV